MNSADLFSFPGEVTLVLIWVVLHSNHSAFVFAHFFFSLMVSFGFSRLIIIHFYKHLTMKQVIVKVLHENVVSVPSLIR